MQQEGKLRSKLRYNYLEGDIGVWTARKSVICRCQILIQKMGMDYSKCQVVVPGQNIHLAFRTIR